jgi:hypothetical protein
MVRRSDWIFVAAVATTLGLASTWSRLTGDLTSERVAELVGEKLRDELGLQSADVPVFSIVRKGDRRAAAVRLLGKPVALEFSPSRRNWTWTAAIPEGSVRAMTVDDYLRALRASNERAAIEALRLVNTVQTAARIRTGRYLLLTELQAAGLLPSDIIQHPPAGYRLDVEATSDAYRIFATPIEHPKSGIRSFYSDTSLAIRGADHQGQRARASDAECEN